MTQVLQLLKRWLCNDQSSIFVKNRVCSVDQSQLPALLFAVHLIDLLNILLRYNGFTRIREAVVDQMGSRPPNSDHNLPWCKSGFGVSLELLLGPTTELLITYCMS